MKQNAACINCDFFISLLFIYYLLHTFLVVTVKMTKIGVHLRKLSQN